MSDIESYLAEHPEDPGSDIYLNVYGDAILAARNGDSVVEIGRFEGVDRKMALRAIRGAYNEIGSTQMPRVVEDSSFEDNPDEKLEQFLDDFAYVYKKLTEGYRTINVPLHEGGYNIGFRRAAVAACRQLGISLEDVDFVGVPNKVHNDSQAVI